VPGPGSSSQCTSGAAQRSAGCTCRSQRAYHLTPSRCHGSQQQQQENVSVTKPVCRLLQPWQNIQGVLPNATINRASYTRPC
jgi:hypothetical protein